MDDETSIDRDAGASVRLRLLGSLLSLLGDAGGPASFAEAATRELHGVFPAARVSVVRRADDGGLVVLSSRQPAALGSLTGSRLVFRRLGSYLSALENGAAAVVEDPAEWSGPLEPPRAPGAPGLPLVDVPLRRRRELLGILRLEAAEASAFTSDALASLLDAAAVIAVGLDGRERDAEPGTAGPVPSADARRVEERVRALEEALRHSQKMEAVGRLAGGVAHDFNNLLTAILGHGHLVLGDTLPTDPRYAALTEILRAGERAAALTGRLLAFSRKQVMSPAILDLNAVVADVEAMLRRLIGEDVVLTVRVGRPLWPVSADAVQLQQVLVNLVVNARDAMPDGGRLTIATQVEELGPDAFRLSPDARPGAWAVLTVRDTGVGMSEETAAHLFEPFFTTKGPGKGTGLGLSTAYGIVKQSGGFIAVETAPGKGSTFRVYLPSAGDATPKPASQPAFPRVLSKTRGTETILLAEDDAAVRKMAAQVLRAAGYEVVEAADGEEALLVAEDRTDEEARGAATPIDLLVTDVVMPRLPGSELARRLVASRPKLKVLFISGYTDHEPRPAPVDGEAFLPKPFAPNELLSRVRSVLDGASG